MIYLVLLAFALLRYSFAVRSFAIVSIIRNDFAAVQQNIGFVCAILQPSARHSSIRKSWCFAFVVFVACRPWIWNHEVRRRSTVFRVPRSVDHGNTASLVIDCGSLVTAGTEREPCAVAMFRFRFGIAKAILKFAPLPKRLTKIYGP